MGKSKMSLNNLVLHGLNGMAIFFEIILVRFLIFLISTVSLSGIFIASFITLKANNFVGIFSWINSNPISLVFLFILLILIIFLIFLKILNIKINNLNDT